MQVDCAPLTRPNSHDAPGAHDAALSHDAADATDAPGSHDAGLRRDATDAPGSHDAALSHDAADAVGAHDAALSHDAAVPNDAADAVGSHDAAVPHDAGVSHDAAVSHDAGLVHSDGSADVGDHGGSRERPDAGGSPPPPTAYSFDVHDDPLPFPYHDFASGELKAECASGSPIAGLSAYGEAHSILCETPYHDSFEFEFDETSITEEFSTSDSADVGRRGDWDPGTLKGECKIGDVAKGVAQTLDGQIDRLECTHYRASSVDYVTTAACATHTFPGDYPSPLVDPDWATDYYMLECDGGTALVGISADIDTHQPHAILCCSVQSAAP